MACGVIGELEKVPELLDRLPVVVNNLAVVRGDRLVVPWQPHAGERGGRPPIEVSVRYTAPVQAVLEPHSRQSPVGTLVREEFPDAVLWRMA